MPPLVNHKLPPEALDFPKTLRDDQHRMEEAEVPIVTVSASFRGEIAEHLGERAKNLEEAVFSRAHFSMALGVFAEANKMGFDAWLVDPMNYVSEKEWKRVLFVEKVGELTARFPLLKKLKDIVDSFARRKLPIANAITPPLLYATSLVEKTIISMHYETGNLLVREGKSVLQVVTDPHVRPHYLFEADNRNIAFAVFDEETKKEFLQKAKQMGKHIGEDRIHVTGPPVDPRIIAVRVDKHPTSFYQRGLHLVITTGGLGTNRGEILELLGEIAKKIKSGKVSVILHASTHVDFRDLFTSFARNHDIPVGRLENEKAHLRIIYDPSIVEVNHALVKFGFPWADGFVTKPSGDMAYDAAASGCFILSLSPWGEWEENIEKRFTSLNVLQKAQPRRFGQQLDELEKSGWISQAITSAGKLDKLFLEGARNIVNLQQELSGKKST